MLPSQCLFPGGEDAPRGLLPSAPRSPSHLENTELLQPAQACRTGCRALYLPNKGLETAVLSAVCPPRPGGGGAGGAWKLEDCRSVFTLWNGSG